MRKFLAAAMVMSFTTGCAGWQSPICAIWIGADGTEHTFPSSCDTVAVVQCLKEERAKSVKMWGEPAHFYIQGKNMIRYTLEGDIHEAK